MVNQESRNPLDIRWPGRPFCAHEAPRLVRWSDGGFVKWQCESCGESKTLSENEFHAIEHDERCSECGKVMEKATLIYENYGYRCEDCDQSVLLGDLLPHADRDP